MAEGAEETPNDADDPAFEVDPQAELTELTTEEGPAIRPDKFMAPSLPVGGSNVEVAELETADRAGAVVW